VDKKSVKSLVVSLVMLATSVNSGTPLRVQSALATESQDSDAHSVSESIAKDDDTILLEIKNHNQVLENLEYLTDMIGPRLTGSPKLEQATHWAEEVFDRYGLSNVHLEPWMISHSWSRGTASGRIVSPTEQALTVVSAGWSPSTPGTIRGRVVFLDAERVEGLQRYRGKLKGAIVITSRPLTYKTAENAVLVPFGDFAVPVPVPSGDDSSVTESARDQLKLVLGEFFRTEGVAAVLASSDEHYGLFNMKSVSDNYGVGFVPTALLTLENYKLVWRLMQRGPVDVELQLTNAFSENPVQVFNTVADIPGETKPDDVVILGAHLDSWDLGTGATDNGTGTTAVLEAARALRTLGLRTKRTIRFVLFIGEEQGNRGSRAYVEAHKSDLTHISALLVHDSGTGRVESIMLMGNYQDREILDNALAPLRQLGLLELSLRQSGGTDHEPFADAGIPAFVAIQDARDYGKTHHSQADTFDRVVPADLIQSAQALAVWAYNVAQLPEMLPRKSAPHVSKPEAASAR
jgi:carboxypeptidase Q